MDNELKHYGVIGMKWGVRKDPSKAYAKASKKVDKIDAKLAKQQRKVSKRVQQYNRAKYGWSNRNAEKAEFKLQRAQYKYEKTLRKGAKWINQMDSIFSKTSVKLTDAHKAKGKEYADALAKREEARINKIY